ncbi:MAG TPA: ubiquitin-like domain-containing protein [Candidatus Saccharimonadales bacterium]
MKHKSKKIYSKAFAGFSILRRWDYKHQMFIPLTTVVILFFLAVIIFLSFNSSPQLPSSSRVVELYNSGKLEIIPTTATTVGDLMKRLGITLNPGDFVSPGRNTPILNNGFRINVYRIHPATIIDNSQTKVILTADIDPRVVAEEAGYTIYPQDYVTDVTSPTELAKNIIGQVISIVPATQINLTLYGTQVSLRTHAKTVADLLAQNKIKTTNGTNVLPALNTPIISGMQVLVVPVGQQLISVQQPIAFATQYVDNPNIPINTTQIVQAGVTGSELVVEQIVTKDGNSTSSAIQTVVISQPIEQIIDRGTGISSVDGGNNITWLRSSSIASSDYGYVNYIISHESGWCPTKWQGEVGYCPGYYQALYPTSAGIGYGLGQATPGNKMAKFGSDWETNPVTQLSWANSYAVGRYGSWEAAYNHWVTYHNW